MDLERRLAWREGVIVFAGEPLSEVVGQMSRYSGVPIFIEDDRLRTIPIGGRFKVGDVDSMLEGLESLFGVEVRRDADGAAHIDVRR
jgi:transmembrane sensor